MPSVKCPECPATVELNIFYRAGQRGYESVYGPDFLDWCKNPVRAGGDPDRTPKCPYMEEAVKDKTRRLDETG